MRSSARREPPDAPRQAVSHTSTRTPASYRAPFCPLRPGPSEAHHPSVQVEIEYNWRSYALREVITIVVLQTAKLGALRLRLQEQVECARPREKRLEVHLRLVDLEQSRRLGACGVREE